MSVFYSLKYLVCVYGGDAQDHTEAFTYVKLVLNIELHFQTESYVLNVHLRQK